MLAIDKLKEVSAFLETKGIDDPAKEAEMLIIEALLKNQLQVLSFKFQDQKRIKAKIYAGDLNIDDETLLLIDNFAERRAHGEPLQYISGHVEFLGLIINVGKGVLIPRPETELLAEEAIKLLKETTPLSKGGQGGVNVLDLCTGSGCIALALAKYLPNVFAYGVDQSNAALSYARQNALLNGIGNVSFFNGDLFAPVKGMCFDAIVSNPPYVKKGDILTLQREVRYYEPIEALDGGEDGLDFFRRIFVEAPMFLKEKGLLIMELGVNQSGAVEEFASKAGFGKIKFVKDYASIERIFIGELN